MTERSVSLFDREFRDLYLFHVPHSATAVPDMKGFLSRKAMQREIDVHTDWATNQLFFFTETDQIVCPWSRVFCDVERLPDPLEHEFGKGQGFCYTRDSDGSSLRVLSDEHKKSIFETYYAPYHARIEQHVREKLTRGEVVYIIDCHSFNNTPLPVDANQTVPRADICLGTDHFHTPELMVEEYRRFFEAHGFSVALNVPYAGTLVPLSFYQKDNRVRSIMIEVNKRLYMKEENQVVDYQKVAELNHLLAALFFDES